MSRLHPLSPTAVSVLAALDCRGGTAFWSAVVAELTIARDCSPAPWTRDALERRGLIQLRFVRGRGYAVEITADGRALLHQRQSA